MSPGKKPTKPIDIYVRYSQVGSRDRGSIRTLEEQEEACRAQLEVDGLEVGQVFSDAAVSGGKRSRPAFDQVLARARSGESGGFIVYDLTRFGRYRSMAQDIIELEKAGATFLAVKDKVDTSSPSSRAFLTIMEAMSVMHREQVEERLRTSQINAVARGVHISPNVPPGYVKGKDGILVPDPQHKVTMEHAFKMAAQGSSRSEIAKYLTERKLPSAGRPIEWSPSRIGRLLANPVYKGQARYGEIKKVDAHRPIIDPVTWERAQREQADPELLISETSEWLLSGFVRCASCRYAMRTMPGRPSTIPVYRCHCTNAEAKCPHPVTISMTALDDCVFAQWADRVFASERESVPERDNSQAEAELAAANAAYATLIEEEEDLDPLEYARAATKYKERIEELEKVLAKPRRSADQMFEEAKPEMLRIYEETIAHVEAGGRVLDNTPPEAIKLLRQAMAREIRAVFVRPAQTTGRGSKAEDRVKILWAGDDLPEMPRRGVTFEPRPYVWDSEPQEATA